jgi:hypothetical protein
MKPYQAIRKERAAGFAEVIAFPAKSDINSSLRKLADHIERSSDPDAAVRQTPAPKPDNARSPARRPISNHKQRSKAATVARAGMFGVVALLSTAAGWALSGYYLDAAQRALDDRASDLARYALTPGSPLACLSGYAGDMVETSCEDAVFATPQAAAAAVSYVAAGLSLLADADASNHGSGYAPALTRLRNALETDRFGFVAHVLSVRDGCTPDRCRAFSLLGDSHKISANLSAHVYESYVARHLARWQTAELPAPPIASSSGETAAARRAGAPDANKPIGPKLNLPSIPAVSIMEPETPPPPRKR